MILSLFTTGIYGYLDLILIGWTLGLVWLAVRALVTAKGSFAQKVRAGLDDEVFLFGGWGGDVRAAVGGWMFLLSVVLLQFDMFFMNRLVRELDLPWYSVLAPWLNIAYSMLLILKIVLFTRYSGRQLAVAYCFFFVFRWVYLNNHQYWFVMALFYMLAAKDAPLRRTLKAGLVISCAASWRLSWPRRSDGSAPCPNCGTMAACATASDMGGIISPELSCLPCALCMSACGRCGI